MIKKPTKKIITGLKKQMEEKKIYKNLKKLIGNTIIDIEISCDETPDHINENDRGYVIVFDNGRRLAARDGEYGDNAFYFVNKKHDELPRFN